MLNIFKGINAFFISNLREEFVKCNFTHQNTKKLGDITYPDTERRNKDCGSLSDAFVSHMIISEDGILIITVSDSDSELREVCELSLILSCDCQLIASHCLSVQVVNIYGDAASVGVD